MIKSISQMQNQLSLLKEIMIKGKTENNHKIMENNIISDEDNE